MELQSCFISDPEIVHSSKKVLIYAEGIAKEYNFLASDLILAAVWHCLNQANKTFSTDNQEKCEKQHSDRVSDINDDDKKLKNEEKYRKGQRSYGLDTGQQNLESGHMLTKGTVEREVEVDDMCKEKNSQLPKHSDPDFDKQTKADIKLNERARFSVNCQENTNDLINENCNDRYSSEPTFSSAKTEVNVSAKNLGKNYKSNCRERDGLVVSEKETISKSQVKGSSKQAKDAQTTKQKASVVKEVGSHSKTEREKVRDFATDIEVISLDDEDSNNFCSGSKRTTIAQVETIVSKGKVEESEPDYFDMDCDEIDDDAEYEEMLNTTDESARERSPRKLIKEDCDENQSLCVNDSDITIISDDEDEYKKNIENKNSESTVTEQLSKSTNSNKSPRRQETTPSKRKQAHSNIKVDFLDKSAEEEEENVVKDIAIKNVQVNKEQSSSKQINDRKASDSSEFSCITAVLGLDYNSSTKLEDRSSPEMPPEQSHIPESQTESALPGPPESSSSLQCLDTVKSPPRKRRLLDYDKKWHMEPKYSPEQDKYLALPGGIDGNPVLTDWRQPGKYNSISQFSSSQQGGFEKVYSDYINIRSVEDDSHVDDDEQDGDDDTDYDISKDNSFSDSSDEDNRNKQGKKIVTRGRPRGRPRLHGRKAIVGIGRGITKETKHSRGSVRGVRGRPRGRSSLRGSLSKRGGTRTRNVSVKEFSSKSDQKEKCSPKLTSFMRGLSFRSRGRKIGFYSLKFGKPRLTADNATMLGSQGVVKRGPGRPRKHALHSNMDRARSSVGRDKPGTSSSADQPIKRGRGRPRSVRGVGTRGRANSKPPEERIRKEEELEDVIIID